MTTKTDELKPCPFCGSADIHIAPDEVGSGGQWVGPVHVVCGGDCVAGQTGDDKESAVSAWNRRAALQSQDRDCVAALRMALQALEAIADEMTVRDRLTNAGQYLLDALGPVREAIDHARRVEGDGE